MVLIDGIKYACERCIRGHRVTTCNHTDAQLIPIKPKGRPVSQCSHCREARKARALHTKCLCGASASGKNHAHSPSCPCAIDPNQCTCLKSKRARSVSTSSTRRSSKGNTPPLTGGGIGIRHNDSHVSLTSLSSVGSSASAPPLFIPDQQLSSTSLARNAGHNIPLIITTNGDNSPYYGQSISNASPSPINSNTNSFISLSHQPSVSHNPLSLISHFRKLGSDDDGSGSGNQSGGDSNSSISHLPADIGDTIPKSEDDTFEDDDAWLALTATATITAQNYSHPSSSASVSVSPQHTGSGISNGIVVQSSDVSSRAPSIRSFNPKDQESHNRAVAQQPEEPLASFDGSRFLDNGESLYNESEEILMAVSSFDSFGGENESENVEEGAVVDDLTKKSNTQLWLDILAPTSGEDDDGFDWSAISEASMKSEVALPSESGLSSTFDDATPQTASYLYNSFLPRNFEAGQFGGELDRPPSTGVVSSHSHQHVNTSTGSESITGRALPDMWNYFAE